MREKNITLQKIILCRLLRTFPVMRHPDTRKWFANIMDVPKDKLGLTGQQRVDVINVKLSDPSACGCSDAAGRIFQRISF